MTYQPITPFQGAVTGDILRFEMAVAEAEANPEAFPDVSKWDVLHALRDGRAAYGLNDRQLTVLQALLTFHPEKTLSFTRKSGRGVGGLIVFPSNASICARLNGMPCSTMRRHLSALVKAGVILRRDSPNGKRYARRGAGEGVAFGFDLSPLVIRFTEFKKTAAEAQLAEERLRDLRHTITAARRDLMELAQRRSETSEATEFWAHCVRSAQAAFEALRRKLDEQQLSRLLTRLRDVLNDALRLSDQGVSVSTNGTQNEQQIATISKKKFNNVGRYKERTTCSTLVNPRKSETKFSSHSFKDLNDAFARVLAKSAAAQKILPMQCRSWADIISTARRLPVLLGICAELANISKHALGELTWSAAMFTLVEQSNFLPPKAFLENLMKLQGTRRAHDQDVFAFALSGNFHSSQL